jgi:hypothetical protein
LLNRRPNPPPTPRTERSAQLRQLATQRLPPKALVLVCVGAAADGVLSGAWYGFAVALRRTSSGHALHVFVPPPHTAPHLPQPTPPPPRCSSRPRQQARARAAARATTEKSAHPTKRDAPHCPPKTSVSTPLHLPLSTRLGEISWSLGVPSNPFFGPFGAAGTPRGPLQPSHLAQIF